METETILPVKTTNPTTTAGPNTTPATTTPSSQSIKKGPTILSNSEIHQKAQELSERRKLPKSPGLRASIDELEEWLRLLTPEMWEAVKGYVYRLHPVIIRKLANPDAFKYIDKVDQDLIKTPGGIREYIKHHHGGGKYDIYITELDTDKKICQTNLTIQFDEIMPILDYREIDVNSDKNLGYINILRARGILDGKGQPQVTQPQVIHDNSSAAMADLSKTMMTMFMQLSKEQQANIAKMLGDSANKGTDVTALFLEKLKQENPNNQLTLVTTLINAMKEMMPKQDNGSSQSHTYDKLLEIQSKAHSESMALMTKLLELNMTAKQTAPPADDSFLDKLLKYKEILPGLFGNGQGTKQLAEIIVDGVKDIGLPVLGLASQLIQLRTGAKPIVPVTAGQAEELVQGIDGNGGYQSMAGGQVISRLPPARGNAPPNTTAPNVVQMPQQQSVSQQTAQPTSQQPTPQSGQANQPELSLCQKLIMQYGNLLITPIVSGMSGAEIGFKLKEFGPLVGMDVYGMLKGAGKDEILSAMESIPAFWDKTGKVLGKEQIEGIVDDFLDYENILAQQEEEEESPIA